MTFKSWDLSRNIECVNVPLLNWPSCSQPDHHDTILIISISLWSYQLHSDHRKNTLIIAITLWSSQYHSDHRNITLIIAISLTQITLASISSELWSLLMSGWPSLITSPTWLTTMKIVSSSSSSNHHGIRRGHQLFIIIWQKDSDETILTLKKSTVTWL